jgi:hypothetical protein
LHAKFVRIKKPSVEVHVSNLINYSVVWYQNGKGAMISYSLDASYIVISCVLPDQLQLILSILVSLKYIFQLSFESSWKIRKKGTWNMAFQESK